MPAHARGRVARHHPNRGDGLAGRAGAGFCVDRDDVLDLSSIASGDIRMPRSKVDVWVGFFVLLGAAAILFLALKAGNLLTLSFDSNYTVTAPFDNISHLQ